MTASYVADDLIQPLRQGRILELRQTQAVVEDTATRRRWALPYAAVIADATAAAQPSPQTSPSPPRAQRADFMVGDTVAFTDQHLHERIGTIVRISQKTASVQCNPDEATGVSRLHFCTRSSTSELPAFHQHLYDKHV